MRVSSGIPASSVPANGPSKAVAQAAKDLESLFLQQLTTELAKVAQPVDDGAGDSSGAGDGSTSSGADGVTQLYTQMLPDAMAQSLSAAGGVGLAADLAKSLGGGR